MFTVILNRIELSPRPKRSHALVPYAKIPASVLNLLCSGRCRPRFILFAEFTTLLGGMDIPIIYAFWKLSQYVRVGALSQLLSWQRSVVWEFLIKQDLKRAKTIITIPVCLGHLIPRARLTGLGVHNYQNLTWFKITVNIIQGSPRNATRDVATL